MSAFCGAYPCTPWHTYSHFLEFASDHHTAFSIILMGNQIADIGVLKKALCPLGGRAQMIQF
jgi:hypothetical protein